MTDFKEFAGGVAKMRRAQQDYFRKRTQTCLKEAKAAEAEVDRMLLDIAPGNVAVRANLASQTKLFEEPG